MYVVNSMSRRTAFSLVFLVLAVVAWFLLRPDDHRPPGARASTILLLTPDTLRWDHVSAYAPEDGGIVHPNTPAMDKIASEGLRFQNARTPVPLTLPAHLTMLTGLPPALTGVRLNTYGRLPTPEKRGFPMLQEKLKDAGWHTAAFVSAGVLAMRYGLEQGFDHYDDGDLTDLTQMRVPERTGRNTVAAMKAYVARLAPETPLFLWVHLFEPHAPYEVDGSYASDVIDCDSIIGRLRADLQTAGRNDVAILLASDHGEALGDLGERTHGLLLADSTLRVPFLLRVPDLDPGVRTDPAELADVAPTLAGIAGVAWPTLDKPGCGIDLLAGAAPADRIRVAETLYGHHLHRWAQLVAASGPTGTLIDAGRDRLHGLKPLSFQQGPRATTGAVQISAEGESRRLAQAIADYKQLERSDRMGSGGAYYAGGYGGVGAVAGFLPPEENARLPDPYTSIQRHHELDQIKAHLLQAPPLRPRHLEAILQNLEGMALLDPLSPEVPFWIGMAHERLARSKPAQGHEAAAERAYLKAFELGRKNSETLARACGVNAGDRDQECLERLETLGKQLPHLGCHYWVLKVLLLRKLKAPQAEIDKACDAAEAVCTTPKKRALFVKTCR